VDLDDRIEAWQSNPERLFAMDAALESLREADPRCAEVVHLRFILGFSVDQTAELMAVSKRTVQRDWDFARAWLEARLKA
jgi:DNA-directed RNA polymerase specialized sigma24 family protein